MGSYTPNFKFYKPDPTEFVDVESQLNSNLRIVDKVAKPLMEYVYTDVESISETLELEKKPGYRFYKPYSNSHWYVTPASNLAQDNRAHVDSWFSGEPYLAAGWQSVPGLPLHYCLVNTEGPLWEVHWMGAIQKTDGSTIAKNVATTVLTGMPAQTIPTKTKFCMCDAGNTTSNFSMVRMGFFIGGTCSIFRMGVDPAGSERRIDFGGVKYINGES